MTPFRLFANAVTLVGIGLLVIVVHDFFAGTLAADYYPGDDHTAFQRLTALFLALPVALHVVFIGQIIQKNHLPAIWRRIVWIGITASGLWLGAALALEHVALNAI